MEKQKLEKIEARIKELYRDTKEDHTLCGKYSKLLQVAKQVLEEEKEENVLVKRLRIAEGKLTHAVLWNEATDLEVLFLVTQGKEFLGCASWKIPVEDRNNPKIFTEELHGDKTAKWLKQEYLQEVFF